MFNESLFELSYLDVSVHKMMLQDVHRTKAYEQAIKQVVMPEHTVMDFGCGTGVLSIFASRFGAKRVYAVDRTRFIQVAQRIANENAVTNIEFYHDDHNTLKLDEKVDVLVSEWMGHFLFYEEMLEPLLRVRDRFLKEGGVMIPKEVSLHAALLVDDKLHNDLSFFRRAHYGIDYSTLANVPFEQVILDCWAPNQLCNPEIDLGTLDLLTLEKPPEELRGKMVAEKDVTVYGICGWFDALTADGIRLGTGPNDPATHWNQMMFPLEQPFEIKAGREISIEIVLPISSYDRWEWAISDGTSTIHHNNMRFRETSIQPLPGGKL